MNITPRDMTSTLIPTADCPRAGDSPLEHRCPEAGWVLVETGCYRLPLPLWPSTHSELCDWEAAYFLGSYLVNMCLDVRSIYLTADSRWCPRS